MKTIGGRSSIVLYCVITPAIGLLLGCSASDEATITGTVSFDGQPVTQGAITYENLDGTGQTYGCEIIDGKYQADNVKFGVKIVKVRAVNVGGQEKKYPDQPNSPVTEVYESFIPVKYNDLSELRLNVDQSAMEENYDLKS